jgi:peptidoglycan/xylan/chitin deacetylase (PgdA/CDA1 family)
MRPDEEKTAYSANIQSIQRATGTTPVGFNAFGMRHTPVTLALLQELGFQYHVDTLAGNEPSLVSVNEKPFVLIPYTLRNNDFVRYGNPATTAKAFVQDLRDDFDALYEEAGQRRRMMSVATHDRISGAPGLAYALREFLHYARSKSGVVFMRKDHIAQWMLSDAPSY